MNNRHHLSLLILYIGLTFLVLPGTGWSKSIKAGNDSSSRPESRKEQHNNRNDQPLRAVDLMPFRERSGFFLLHKSNQDHPEELPFSFRKRDDQQFVLVKKNRVKHVMSLNGKGQIVLEGEIDLRENREVTFSPAIPLLPATINQKNKISGSSNVTVTDASSGESMDEGTCSWSLVPEGKQNVSIQGSEYSPYRFRLVRNFDMGGIKHARLTVQFDYVPNVGQIRAEVSHDAQMLGFIGPKEEWTIERIKEVSPRLEPGSLMRDTMNVIVKRYDRARAAFRRDQPGEVDRILKQILRVLERIDVSLTNLSEGNQEQMTEIIQSLHNKIESLSGAKSRNHRKSEFHSLSRILWNLLRNTGHSLSKPVRLLRNTGKAKETRYWLGRSARTVSPFHTEGTGRSTQGIPVRYIPGSHNE